MRERRILFATDFTGDVAGGLRLATRLAAERAATLVVLHVIPFDPADGEGLLHGVVAARGGGAERKLAGLVPDDPGVPYLHALEMGAVEDCIAAFVRRERVELLVLEARRHSLVRRALGRSLAERLLDRVDCPVVTYRAGRAGPVGAPPPHAGACRPPADVLTTLLNARVDALLSWMQRRQQAVRDVAAVPSVREGVAGLYRTRRHGVGGVFAPRMQALLELELAEHQLALGAVGVEVAVDGAPLVRLGLGARADAAHARFVQRVRQRGADVSVPLDAADDDAAVGCVILAGVTLELAQHEAAQLSFAFDARRDFLRILAQPGPVPSAETYAFDEQGVMLSNSRFPDQLRKVGLLPPEPGAQTPRRLRLCDPGGNLLAGEGGVQPSRPLTRMAAAATAGHDGCDWKGYRDYRGVEVVGAWRWLPSHGFGVAAEMDLPHAVGA